MIKLDNLLWINLDKNKHDFSEQIRDQSVTEKEIHGLQHLGGYVVIHNLYNVAMPMKLYIKIFAQVYPHKTYCIYNL